MRVLKYPKGAQLVAGFHHEQFWVVCLGYDPESDSIAPIFTFINSEGSLSVRLSPRAYFTGLRVNSEGRPVLLVRGLDPALQEVDFLTGEVRPFSGGEIVPHDRGNNYYDCDDNWVVMSGAAARTHGWLVMGPTAYADGVHLPKYPQRPDGHLVIYRRGGSARTLKVPGRFVVTNVCIAPDGLTALAAGNRSAVIVDLE